ncbi:MAG: hypothetical protein IIW23_02905 [Clostridia bacterium]|nr:hypothetical protein [Clostridia bacterium]
MEKRKFGPNSAPQEIPVPSRTDRIEKPEDLPDGEPTEMPEYLPDILPNRRGR